VTKSIRVLIADDHQLIRAALRQLLQGEVDIEVVGEAADGIEALEKVRALHPDVLLLDIAMPRMGGLEVLPLMRELRPKTEVVILSMYAKEAYTHQALTEGARAYVLKGAPSADVLAAVRAVHGGGYFFSAQIHTSVIDTYLDGHRKTPGSVGYYSLTEREKQVFHLLIEGHSSQHISELLYVSLKTVEKHRANICCKLGLHSSVGMVKYAIRYGIIDPDLWKS
jgi:two-component system, NarL family, response regulator NreC